MPVLSTKEKLIGSSSFKINNATATLSIYAKLNSQNITNNTSSVTRKLVLRCATTWYANCSFKLGNSSSSYTSGKGTWTSSSNLFPKNTNVTLLTQTITVNHDVNGDATVPFYGYFQSVPWDAYSTLNNLSATLPRIPRASSADEITNSAPHVAGVFSVKYTPKSSEFYNEIQLIVKNSENIAIYFGKIRCGQKDVTQQTQTIQLSDSDIQLLVGFTSEENVRFGAIVSTYSDSSYTNLIGSNMTSFITLQNISTRDFTPTLLVDTTNDAETNSLTGTTNKFIRGISHVRASFSVNPTTGISKYCTNFDSNWVEQAANYRNLGLINDNTTVQFRIKESTGQYTAIKSKSIAINGGDYQLINYAKPTISNLVLYRDGNNPTVNISFKINLWYQSFGSQFNNSVKITIKYKKGTDSSFATYQETKSISSAQTSYSKNISVPADTDLQVEILVEDKASSSVAYQAYAPKAVPLIVETERYYNINGDLLINGESLLDRISILENKLRHISADANSTTFASGKAVYLGTNKEFVVTDKN